MERNYRQLPSVDKLMAEPRIKQIEDSCTHSAVLDLIRQHLDNIRGQIQQGSPCPSIEEIVESVCIQAEVAWKSSLQRVLNATGVILHTNLGRAAMSQEATSAMLSAATGYCNLEIDIHTGKRGSRQVHIESLLCQLTGAEAAMVVNNNASAVLLGLAALSKGKEVIVSRGQSVEIGGGFRIPEVMRQSGARLIEVGTTNCTRSTDYEEAITQKTSALLRVHSSNFKIVGFTQEATLEELTHLGKRHNLPVLDDLGSGCLIDTSQFGLNAEPTVQESISVGTDLAFFSGDKLIGGPQAGIIVGKKSLVDRLQKHPMARAMRIDKIRLAGLAETLLHYARGEAEIKIPIWRMISTPLDNIEKRANEWIQALNGQATVINGESMVGGGSLPGGTLPTYLVTLRMEHTGTNQLAKRLRNQLPPVIARIDKDLLLLDPRTILPEDDIEIIRAIRTAIRLV